MPTENPDGRPSDRRIITRRSRGGARFSSHARVDGTPRNPEPDEVDDAIDPEVVDTHVRNLSRAPSGGDPSGDDPINPQSRLNDLARTGDAAYAKDYRLTLMHRLLMRNIPIDQIAQQLNISLSTAQKDRVLLKKRLREYARDLNIDEMVGQQSVLYDEVAGMAMRIATKTSGQGAVPIPMQLAALRTALASQADKTRFYTSTGVLDVLRFRKADTGSAQSDIQVLMEETRRMLSGLMEDPGMGDFAAFNPNEDNAESEDL